MAWFNPLATLESKSGHLAAALAVSLAGAPTAATGTSAGFNWERPAIGIFSNAAFAPSSASTIHVVEREATLARLLASVTANRRLITELLGGSSVLWTEPYLERMGRALDIAEEADLQEMATSLAYELDATAQLLLDLAPTPAEWVRLARAAEPETRPTLPQRFVGPARRLVERAEPGAVAASAWVRQVVG